jgi:uncharacterized protein HemY
MKANNDTIPKWMKMPRKEKKAYKKKMQSIRNTPEKRSSFIEMLIEVQRQYDANKILYDYLNSVRYKHLNNKIS